MRKAGTQIWTNQTHIFSNEMLAIKVWVVLLIAQSLFILQRQYYL